MNKEEMKAKRHNIPKKVRILVVVLLLASIGIWYAFGRDNGDLRLPGRIEAALYTHNSEVQGRILESPVEQGQSVKKGDVLFVLDATAQIYALEQLELTLVQKEMALQQLSDGAGEEAVRQAKNAVVIAQATYDKAAEDHRSASALYAEGAIPRTVLDAAVYQMNVAAAQLDSARQQVQSIASGAGDAVLEAARAAVAQTESQIRQLQETIQKYKISAEVDGVVVSRNYGVGDMVAPGYDLMEIAADEEVFVIAYLPVDRVPELDHGQMLSVEGSGYNALATVVFIDVKAQYTPKDMQSSATKNRDSVKLRLRLPSDADFQPGETVTVIIPRSIDPYKLPS